MTEEKEYAVFVFGWDLIPLSEVVTSFVRSEQFPTEFIHVGIGVYNRLYHFNKNGISVCNSMPKNYKIYSKGGDGVTYFKTKKTQAEVEQWITLERVNFKAGDYNLMNRNCITFAQKLFDFFDITDNRFPEECESLRSWLLQQNFLTKANKRLDNSRIARIFAALGSSSFRTSSISENVDLYAEAVVLVSETLANQITLSGSLYNSDSGEIREIK